MNSCIENKIFHPKNADHYENNLTKPDMEGINMKYTVVIKSVLLGSAMLLHGDTVRTIAIEADIPAKEVGLKGVRTRLL